MLRDSMLNQWHMSSVTADHRSLPMPVYMGHPVAVNPTGDPSYIDGQVADILVEMQETHIEPFIEGTPIGTIGQTHPREALFGVERAEFDALSADVWIAHLRLPRAARRHSYTTDRGSFRFTWQPDTVSFTVRRIA